MLTVTSGETTMNRTQVQLWYNRLKKGQEDVNGDVRTGRLSKSTQRCWHLKCSLLLSFGESTMNRIQLQLWYNRLNEGQEYVNDDDRTSRLSVCRLASLLWTEHKFNCGITGLRKPEKMSMTMLVLVALKRQLIDFCHLKCWLRLSFGKSTMNRTQVQLW